MKPQLFVFAIATFLLLELPHKAIAHGVKVEYQPRQGYEISAAYDTGEPMANAQVVLFSPADPATPWQTTQTDAQGRFSFVPTASGNWQVKIQQAGHGGNLTIPVTDAVTAPPASVTSSAAEQPAHSSAAAPAPTVTAATASPLQKGVMVGSVLWGCVGTALFFWRSNKRQQPQ